MANRRRGIRVHPSKPVRLDNEVVEYLAQFAEPLVDTPNTVIKMILGLQPRSAHFIKVWDEPSDEEIENAR